MTDVLALVNIAVLVPVVGLLLSIERRLSRLEAFREAAQALQRKGAA
jgi:hypothetical protein